MGRRPLVQRILLMHPDELHRFETDIAAHGLDGAIAIHGAWSPDPVERERVYLEVEHALQLRRRWACKPWLKGWTLDVPVESLAQWPDAWAVRRFAYKLYPHGDCWEWRGQRQGPLPGALPSGLFGVYGYFQHDGQKVPAHRFAYVATKGVIPAHHEVHHICYHPWCVRPSHLAVFSQQQHQRVHKEHWTSMWRAWRSERSRHRETQILPLQSTRSRDG